MSSLFHGVRICSGRLSYDDNVRFLFFFSIFCALHDFIEPSLDHRLISIFSYLIWIGQIEPYPRYWRHGAGVDTLDLVLLYVYINESRFVLSVKLRIR
jgi:hypothetical protein